MVAVHYVILFWDLYSHVRRSYHFVKLDLYTTIYYTVYLLQKAKYSRDLILISSNNITKGSIDSMTVILSKTFIVPNLSHPVPGAVCGAIATTRGLQQA